VGELLTVEKHPRCRSPVLTTVRVGSGEPLQIVCGARNIEPGQRVPVALPGALLPGNRAIERTEKMGIVSNGMLCSGDELRLSVDGERILILPADTMVGTALTDLYGNWVLDVDVKPNRGDALCLVGFGTRGRGRHRRGGALPTWSRVPAEDGQPIGDFARGGRRGPGALACVFRRAGRVDRRSGGAVSPEHVQRAAAGRPGCAR